MTVGFHLGESIAPLRRLQWHDVHLTQYNVHMKVTATQFRKNLFTILERAVQGEAIDVTYKGSVVRVTPSISSSKLARAKRQDTLLCDPDSIVQSDRKLIEEMDTEWTKDWEKI
jgi:antitoxin (DNA-binding transcriptional repressor) of toxin-antitoxin stability system